MCELPVERSFELLANERRRVVIRCLDDVDGTQKQSELATTVAAREADVAVDYVDDEHVREVALMLEHQHLPKLEASDVVTVDSQAQTVSPTSGVSFLATLLECAEQPS